MKTIYCISGLAADERAFSRLRVDGYTLTCIPWLTPLPKETIDAYAERMSRTIPEQRPVLLGLSFGGMMGIEIAKRLPVEKLILISSVKSRKEMPWWMKAAGQLRLNRVFPLRSSRLTEPIQDRFIGVTGTDDREMVRHYRKHAPQLYVDWAINEILRWRNDWLPPNTFHVHGDADRLFPIQNLTATHVIRQGGHLMVMNKAREVNDALQQILLA